MSTHPATAPRPRAQDDGLLLDVRDLCVSFGTPRGRVRAVDGVNLTLREGEILAVVGESGSGKSVTAQTILGLTRQPGAEFEGEIRYGGRDLVSASEADLRRVRGAEISMIFQDPMTSLNPLQRVGAQIEEMLRLHTDVSKAAARKEAERLLGEVGIGQAADRARRYPHEFSGGMRQRAMIALAIACGPRILIADEPTTALDVTIQAQVLEQLRRLREERGTAIVFITHDLGVVAEVADRVAVMYAGRIVETSPNRELFRDPQHPYTWGLLGSVPRADRPRADALRPIVGSPAGPRSPARGLPLPPALRQEHDRCSQTPPLEARSGDPTTWTRAGWSPSTSAPSAPTSSIRPGGRHERAPSPCCDCRISSSTTSPGPSAPQRRPRGGRRLPGRHGGRDARPRRRVGLRQVDPRALHAAPGGADGRPDPVRRQGHHVDRRARAAARCAARCRWSSRTPTRR
jgi:oligopeptide/dipeptide ABC transporter ATP-binding protein